jgi:hypothetical protein
VTGATPVDLDDLVRRARAVLDRNRAGAYTCPSVRLYPHQWLWDSCFTAIGIARYDATRAADELRALVRGQWDDGMLPHMIFAPGARDAGSTRVWRSRTRAGAPRDVATSCITQPPVVALAVERVARALPADDRDAFVAEVAPKVLAYHRWLFRTRRIDGSPLITLIHPWECGLDSTPPWMHALGRMRMAWWLRTAERLRLAPLLRSLRYDTRQLPASERASDDEGLRMLALAVHVSHYDFDLARIPRDDRAVLIEDLAFNAFFAAANQALRRLIDVGDLDPLIDEHRDALELLWHAPTGEYCSRDAVTHEPLTEPTVATFLPLLATGAHTTELVIRLQDPSAYAAAFPVPSVPLDAPDFQDRRYWSGPTWVNTNWAIVEGLRAQGLVAEAGDLGDRTLAMVEQGGFAEYFSPTDGSGHGAPEFSWTAALVIDLASGEGKADQDSASAPSV